MFGRFRGCYGSWRFIVSATNSETRSITFNPNFLTYRSYSNSMSTDLKPKTKINKKIMKGEAKNANINCIDLSCPDIQKTVSLVKRACSDTGFFYVKNHGISSEFMEEVFAQSKKFFELPLSEKMKLLRNEKVRGYTPLFDERLDPENQVNGDYKEGYYIGAEVLEDDPAIPFHGPNVWPAQDILPGWKDTMEKYHTQALEVGKAVTRIIALALNLDYNFFDKPEILGKPYAILRLLHYQAGAHSDLGMLTLLATDDVAGLQICKNKDAAVRKWENVLPMKGAFIVNIGDMLERWSNGVLKSTMHRVIGNGQERYSIAYFVQPTHECVVECLPTYQSLANPPKFPPVRFQSYLRRSYFETHAVT